MFSRETFWAGINYSFLPLEYMANPIVPNASPATEAPHEKKFKKNVDSRTWMTIRNGRAIPKNIKRIPRAKSKLGEFIKLFSSKMFCP